MKPLSLATGIVALLVLSAWAAGLLQKPQARVLCQDSRRGYLSADMDLEDVTQTAACERLPQVRVTCQNVDLGLYFSGDFDRDAVIETPYGWVLVRDRNPVPFVQVYPTCQIGEP